MANVDDQALMAALVVKRLTDAQLRNLIALRSKLERSITVLENERQGLAEALSNKSRQWVKINKRIMQEEIDRG